MINSEKSIKSVTIDEFYYPSWPPRFQVEIRYDDNSKIERSLDALNIFIQYEPYLSINDLTRIKDRLSPDVIKKIKPEPDNISKEKTDYYTEDFEDTFFSIGNCYNYSDHDVEEALNRHKLNKMN